MLRKATRSMKVAETDTKLVFGTNAPPLRM
jgi:hypothetical protein